MIAVYLRVSSVSQDSASQKSVIDRYLVGSGMGEVEWFSDKSSGTNTDRAEFQRLDGLVMSGKIRTVVCYKLDRLSRSIKDGVGLLTRWLERGVRIVAVSQDLDFSGAVGKMVAAILFAVAEMENENRKERQRAGIELAKVNGAYKGRRTRGIKKKNGPKRARELKERGMSLAEIGRTLGVSRWSAKRYLEMPVEGSNG